MQEQSRVEKQREKRRLKRSLGICIDCNNPVFEGKLRCEKHYHEQKQRCSAWSRQQRRESASASVFESFAVSEEKWWKSFEENYTYEKLEALNGRYHSR